MQVSKWGNSLAVRLPKKLVQEMGLEQGDEVQLSVIGERKLGIVKVEDEDFLAALRALQKPAPDGFRWNREEATQR